MSCLCLCLRLCAELVSRQSQAEGGTQFIVSTFFKELASVGDKLYGVTFENRVSRIGVVSKEEAQAFLSTE